ncbi:MAG: cryptochrome/photolyase family protein [Holophagales bacterium]|nr:cryptochrome/photolyase family protein [Holophagales bacterium]
MSEAFPVSAPPLPEGGPSRLLVILGDQLDPRLLEHAGLEPAREAVVMMEVTEEATHVPSHKARTALFLSAMRHFALDLWDRGVPLLYSRLDEENRAEIRRRAGGLRARPGSPRPCRTDHPPLPSARPPSARPVGVSPAFPLPGAGRMPAVRRRLRAE